MNDLISKRALKMYLSDEYHGMISDESLKIYEIIDLIDEFHVIPAIPIPENATNGDVLKRLLYGKAIITEFIHDVNISVNNNVIGHFDREWWRSPYKRGDTE